MAIWPTTLPMPLASGYSVTPVDPVIRTDMESGAGRTRRRTMARNDRVSLSWIMRDAQVAIYRAWFDADAAGGASWFNVTLAMGTGGLATVEARFTKTPTLSLVCPGIWNVSGEVEVR